MEGQLREKEQRVQMLGEKQYKGDSETTGVVTVAGG